MIKMRSSKQIIAALFSVFLVMSATAEEGAFSFADLQGDWTSNSDALGGPAVSSMQWTPILTGKFFELNYAIERKKGDNLIPLFSGEALYKESMDSEIDAFWADSQGDMLPITADIDDRALVAHWGNESSDKQGRTRYEMTDADTIIVTDHVLHNGEWVQFSNLEFTRIPPATSNNNDSR